VLAVLLALASSLCYALASVLQQRAASAQPDERNLRFGLLARLALQPAWVLGVGADVAGYALQFLALGKGTLVVVQPLLVCGLLFALPAGAALNGRRLDRGDWLGALLTCAGLAVFLAVADPARGRPGAPLGVWIPLLALSALGTACLVVLAVGGGRRRKAVALSAGAGILYGAAAALTKTTAHLLYKAGVLAVATDWHLYLLVAFGAAGMLLGQSAFQAGELDLSLPTMSVVDPVVSVLIGALALREAVRFTPAAALSEMASLAALSVGVFLLARSKRPSGVVEPT